MRSALGALDARCRMVLIHDGGRPFVDAAMVTRVLLAARRHGAAIAAVPVTATIKSSARQRAAIVGRTLDRSSLWEVQTPQVFRKELIIDAHRRFGSGHVTDDSSLVEKMGRPVRIVKSSYCNIKVTTPEDLILAEAIARTRSKDEGPRAKGSSGKAVLDPRPSTAVYV